MMMHNTRDNHKQYKFWKKYFSDQNIKILEMTPDMHDILAAKTQGITHFLGRTLKEFGIEKYVDYQTQFEKSFLEPLKNVLQCIGWQHEKTISIKSFFE